MAETNWMHETFTNAEKRDCVIAIAKGLREGLSEVAEQLQRPGFMGQVQLLRRQISMLDAIAADYDFKDRQVEMFGG